MKNEKEFKEKMVGLSEIFGRKLTKPLTDAYWLSLKPYSDDECIFAFNMAISQCKFFPKPADLIEFINGGEKQIESRATVIAHEIISHLQKHGSTVFPDLHGDKIAKHLMTHRWNYYKWASQVLDSELKWWIKEFVEAYCAYSENDLPIQIEWPKEFKMLVDGIKGV